MLIREIQQKDNESIAKVIRDIFHELDAPKVGTAYADPILDTLYEVYQQSRSIYYVVEKDGNVVGGCGIAPLENADVSVCELQKMYFLQEARGKGIGFEMIQKCLAKAKEFGYEKCYLETLPEMLAAQSLYKKVGFEYICSPIGGTGHTSCPVWMIKQL